MIYSVTFQHRAHFRRGSTYQPGAHLDCSWRLPHSSVFTTIPLVLGLLCWFCCSFFAALSFVTIYVFTFVFHGGNVDVSNFRYSFFLVLFWWSDLSQNQTSICFPRCFSCSFSILMDVSIWWFWGCVWFSVLNEKENGQWRIRSPNKNQTISGGPTNIFTTSEHNVHDQTYLTVPPKQTFPPPAYLSHSAGKHICHCHTYRTSPYLSFLDKSLTEFWVKSLVKMRFLSIFIQFFKFWPSFRNLVTRSRYATALFAHNAVSAMCPYLLFASSSNFSDISCSASTFCPTKSKNVFNLDQKHFCFSASKFCVLCACLPILPYRFGYWRNWQA